MKILRNKQCCDKIVTLRSLITHIHMMYSDDRGELFQDFQRSLLQPIRKERSNSHDYDANKKLGPYAYDNCDL